MIRRMSARPSVLALAFTEASRTCLRSFAADLPTLTRMGADGASGITLAPQPLAYEPMWAAVLTGRTPNGIRHPLRPQPVADLGGPPIWRLLEEAGVPTGAFNMYAFLPEALTGFMVARDDASIFRRELVHPPSLHGQLQARFGTWAMATLARTRDEWAPVPRQIETRADVLIELLRTRPWSFALAQFPDVGRAQHLFWSDGVEVVRALYAATDRTIARIVEAVGPETFVFVFSECGAGPLRYGVQLNAWLEREGYLSRHRSWPSKAALSLGRTYGRGAARLLPLWFHRSRVKARTRAAIAASDVHRTGTRAVSPGLSGEIVLRAPEGERPALAAEIRQRLLALRDPEGRRVVEDVIPGNDGELLPVWDDDAYVPAESFTERGRVFIGCRPGSPDSPFPGSHRREGVLLAHGPGVASSDLGRVRLVDLAPTWLDLLGVSRPSGLDGTSFAQRLTRAV